MSGVCDGDEEVMIGEFCRLMRKLGDDLDQIIERYSRSGEIPVGLGALYCIRSLIAAEDFEQLAQFDDLAIEISELRPEPGGE
jgi:hypothetical protein